MKTIITSKISKPIFDQVNSVLFIIYSYVRLSIDNDKKFDIESNGLIEEFSENYNELFNQYQFSTSNVKEILTQTLLMNSTMFGLPEEELISLVNKIHFFYQTEYMSGLHGLVCINKNNISKAVFNLLDVMFNYGNVSFDYSYPTQLEHNVFINKYIQ